MKSMKTSPDLQRLEAVGSLVELPEQGRPIWKTLALDSVSEDGVLSPGDDWLQTDFVATT